MICKKVGDNCLVHGNTWPCVTHQVLEDVSLERQRQYVRYGDNSSHADGTGPRTRWCQPVSNNSANALEEIFRDDYEEYEEEVGDITWVHLVREEIAEAFKEADESRLEEELIQVAALTVCWIEKIRERRQHEAETVQ